MISLKGLKGLISHSYQLIGDDLRSRPWEGVDDVSFFLGDSLQVFSYHV